MKKLPVVLAAAATVVVIGVVIALVVLPGLDLFDHSVVFDDSGSDLIKLGNPYFELGLSKTNGSIRYITDKATGKHITDGDLEGTLWTVTFTDAVQSSSYSPSGPNWFSYTWSPPDRQLTMDYISDPANPNHIVVKVIITATKGRGFDLQMALENNRGFPPDELRFPANLIFTKSDIKEAILPILPGIVLEPGWFLRSTQFQTSYPGYPGVFGDFMALYSARGSFAMYSKSVDGQGQVVPANFGFYFDNCLDITSTCFTHNYLARILNKTTWTSPKIHVRVSETLNDTINQFRVDDGISDFHSLQTKLGSLYNQLIQMPLYKADASQLGLKFNDYAAMLAKIPYPGLLHPVGYMPGGHDHSYPDFLPPDPKWGTTQDMAAMLKKAQSMGYLVMPYTNPTWWNDPSPTLGSLPPGVTITNLSTINSTGAENEECYGCPANPLYGYAVSPYADFVQKRLSQAMTQMTKEVPSDLIFEDQIGARATIFDYNPASPREDAYTQGWLEHTRTYAASKLMTEDGFDRLAETEIGFNGSALLSERIGEANSWWGIQTWHYYPFATQAGRDKVFFYQHDLAPESFTHNKATLAWNVAMGYMLSYDLNADGGLGGGIEDDWIKVAGAFQKFVLAQYATERITNYAALATNVTQTTFEHFTAVVNWDANYSYTRAGFDLARSGVLIQKNDGSLIAGVFTRYNGSPLSSGDHFLIEDRQAKEITVRQPKGADTPITLRLLNGWSASAALRAQAYTTGGHLIGAVPASVSTSGVTFNYQQALNQQPVAYYVIQ